MSHTRLASARSAVRVTIVLGALSLMCDSHALARAGAPATVAQMTASATRVFRGRCTAVTTGTVEVAGARLPATTYTFRVGEHLKGRHVRTVTFRQLGTPDGGRRDLGRLAELPIYAAGTEYVLFLLPAGAAGLTSPAGAAEGAFVLRDGQVLSARGASAKGARDRPPAPDLDTSSYDELRRVVQKAVGR